MIWFHRVSETQTSRKNKERTLNTHSRMTRSILYLSIISLSVIFSSASLAAEKTAIAKGHQASGSPQNSTVALLALFGELIARERAFGESIYELVRFSRGESPFNLNDATFNAVLGDDFYSLYDKALPELEALGQQSRRAEIEIRFNPDAQKQLIANKTVAGVNDGAVNNVIAHYKIALENIDISARQLILAQSHLFRRSADELARGVDADNTISNYVGYVRASHLVSATRLIKGYMQPRCATEDNTLGEVRRLRKGIDKDFYFNEDLSMNVSVQQIYDTAESMETQALKLSEDGSHCG